MDSFRLILLVIGIILIGGMLLYHRLTSDVPMKRIQLFSLLSRLRRSKPKPSETDEILAQSGAARFEGPDEEDIAALSNLTPDGLHQAVDTEAVGQFSALNHDAAAGSETLVIVLNVMAKAGTRFSGEHIQVAIQSAGFVYNETQKIYQYRAPAGQHGEVLCSLANTVEPGILEPESFIGMETPGLLLFMQLPGPLEGREAFEQVLKLGRGLAEQLGGDLCDESRSVLTLQTIGHLKEKIEAFRFKQKMAMIKQHRH